MVEEDTQVLKMSSGLQACMWHIHKHTHQETNKFDRIFKNLGCRHITGEFLLRKTTS